MTVFLGFSMLNHQINDSFTLKVYNSHAKYAENSSLCVKPSNGLTRLLCVCVSSEAEQAPAPETTPEGEEHAPAGSENK